jgi:branched-chain amino acid transport system permease protein
VRAAISELAGKDDRSKKWFTHGPVLVALLIMSLFVPFFITNDYYLRILVMILVYSILALALNLVTGFTGLLSFCQASFAGVGAYTTAILLIRHGASYPLTVLASIFSAFIFGLAMGIFTIRAGGLYFSVITIGFAEIFRIIALNWTSLTEGATGMVGIPLPILFSFQVKTMSQFYYLALVYAVFSYLSLWILIRSKFGRAIKAIRDDALVGQTMGINVRFYSTLSFAISAAYGGLAGNFLAVFLTTISPTNFTVDESMLILTMIVVGGLGSLEGSFVGAAILLIATELFRPLYVYRLLLIGLIMLIMPIWKRGGLVGVHLERKG